MSGPGTEELERRANARVGTTLDEKWQLDAVLGVGGMASVFAATHRNGKRAAIKVLHPEVALNPSVKARFLREGWVANRVEHPGAVSVLDDDEADGCVFLVMELLEGETLEARCRQEPTMPYEEALVVADQVLDVLAAAHAKNIIHRDLKPGNLFLTKDGAVKVLDFGIARLLELSSGRDAPVQSQTTVSSMGTPGFMPPEQARGRWEEVDGRADLFAVGATMFTLLSGRFIHEEATVNEQMLASMTKQAPPLASVVPDVPAAVSHLVDRALAFSPADRWPDARSMQEAVRAAYATSTGKGIASARKLLVSQRPAEPATSKSPSNATLDLAESGSYRARPPQPSSSSGKPVAVTTPSPGMRDVRVSPRVRLALSLAAAVLVGVGITTMLGLRQASPPPPPVAAIGSPPAPSATAASPEEPTAAPQPTAATDPATVAASEPQPPSPSTAKAAPRSSPRPAAARSAPPASASSAIATPPSATVDIFNRRR